MTTSTQFKNILKSFAVVPLATAGVIASTAIAEAASLTGSFQIGSWLTDLTFSKDLIDFNNDYSSPLPEVGISGGTESFASFQSAYIKDFDLPLAGEINNFLDFSAGQVAPIGSNTMDGIDTFSLTKVSDYLISQKSNGVVGITLEFGGYFTSSTGDITKGLGNFTFQYAENGLTAETFKARLNSGEVFENVTFSGAALTTDVPEPATLLGLLGVGALGAAARKSKKEAES